MLKRLKTSMSTALYMAKDRRYREFYRQRRIVNLLDREYAADRLAEKLPHSPPQDLLALPHLSEQLSSQGYVHVDGLVSRDQIDEIRAFFAELPARDPYRPHLGSFKAPDDVPADTHVSHYSDDQIACAPHVFALANDPRVLALVEGFLGAKPTLAAMRVWWSTPSRTGKPEHAENFHRDVDDLRFIKLFVFLTDVDDESGPHIFAAGSHKQNVLTKIGRYTDSEVESAVGADTVIRLKGPAGTSFLENTYGLHRGLPPVSKPRLVFQPLYTLRPVIFGPGKPLRVRGAADVEGLDPYINRVYLRS